MAGAYAAFNPLRVLNSEMKNTENIRHIPAAPKADRRDQVAASERKGAYSILLMDDEEGILRVTGRMLEVLGCKVSCARHGVEALEIFADALENGRPFDAVIMDLTVRGGLGGKGTILAMREIQPGVKAIVSSGYSNDPVMANYRQYGFCDILSKPYRIEDLRETLARTLGTDPSAPMAV